MAGKKSSRPTGGPGHAGHRASRGSKQPIDEGTVPMVVAVIADGYVYGATETASSDTAEDPRYWLQLRLDREPYALFRATVPSDLIRADARDRLARGRPAWSSARRYRGEIRCRGPRPGTRA